MPALPLRSPAGRLKSPQQQLHPEYKKFYHTKGLSDLFVNWHPAPLGHEVIGNQLAYYHMRVLEQALGAIVAGGTAGLSAVVAKFKADATAGVLPKAVACSEKVCPISTSFAPQCAYAYLPKAQGPDVGDIMVNGTSSGDWVNKLADGQAPCEADTVAECNACAVKGEGVDGCQVKALAEHCFDADRHCSYLDWKRGQRGDATSGPITLGFKDLYQCLIWIGEPPYEWNKPKTLVNWAEEMSIKVDGKACAAPHCTVVKSGDYTQYVQVDARALLGGKCRRQRVDVTLEIVPKPPTAFECDAKCEPSGAWHGYGGNMCKNEGGRCKKLPRYLKAAEVHTFISYAIAF